MGSDLVPPEDRLRNRQGIGGQSFDDLVGAAKDIGEETVMYVDNVYKYYVAYRLAAEIVLGQHPSTNY